MVVVRGMGGLNSWTLYSSRHQGKNIHASLSNFALKCAKGVFIKRDLSTCHRKNISHYHSTMQTFMSYKTTFNCCLWTSTIFIELFKHNKIAKPSKIMLTGIRLPAHPASNQLTSSITIGSLAIS